jgi:YXWGXW repeat-containing protein
MKRTNAVRNLLLSLLLTAAFAAPAYAQLSVSINLAPPAPQYEVVPVLSPGYVWAPGYWGWNGERHIWIRGRSIVQRAGYRWEPDRWEQRDRTYYRTAGHWQHDNSYKAIKVKKEKKDKHWDKGDRGHDNGKHGRGGKHRD